MKYKNKAVVLGANYYIGLSAVRCLGKEGVYVAAVDYAEENAYAFHSKYCNEKLLAPHYKEEPQRFFEFLKQYALKQDAKPVLIPCADPYVEFVEQYFDELKQYYLFPQTEKGLYTTLMNKNALIQLAQKYGMQVPETVPLTKLDEMTHDRADQESVNNLADGAEHKLPKKIRMAQEDYIKQTESLIGYPCIVKPTDSPSFVAIFRRKIFMVNNRTELIKAVQKAYEAKLEVVAQRIIPGFDDHMYTLDAYMNQDSDITHWSTCQKLRQYPINFGASVYTTQKYVPELYDIGAKFFKQIGYKGFAEIEFKKDAVNGKFYLIEINVRITNFNVLLDRLGINIPYLTYLDMVGGDIQSKEVTEDTGITFWYAFEDFFAILDYIRTKQLHITQIIASLFRKKACAIWDSKDPAPFFHYQKLLMQKLKKKLKRK